MADEPRYKVIEGSQSAHCCFNATVVDVSKPNIIGGKQYVGATGPQFEAVCECFEMTEAIRIAKALNECVSPPKGEERG